MSRLALLLLCLSLSLFAQPQATINGSILDSSGAAIPAAAVITTETLTCVTTRTQSDHAGRYTFPALPNGAYRIKATRSGLHSDIHRDVGSRLTVDLALSPGTAEVVEVSAAVTTLITERATSIGGAPPEIDHLCSNRLDQTTN